MKTWQRKTITLCCQRVCGAWLWANQAVIRLNCCWTFFSDLAGWTIRNCQFLVRVCFNQSIKFWEKALKNNFQRRWSWEFLKIVMKCCENKFHQTSLFMRWQKIKRLVPKSQLSAIFMNRQTMFQTQKKSPLSIKIWWMMIFDVLLLQNHNKCEAYYVRGRHSNCDCL